MGRLVIIQNDYPSTGKSTLALCLHRYLQKHGISHQMLTLGGVATRRFDPNQPCDQADQAAARAPIKLLTATHLEANNLCYKSLLACVTAMPLTILDIDTGTGSFFNHFYEKNNLSQRFHEAAVSVCVVLPVTANHQSFGSVTDVVEIFSDNANYLIAHLVKKGHNDGAWSTSYAARLMDMFEAIEFNIPEITFHMELRSERMSLDKALQHSGAETRLGIEYVEWKCCVMEQIDIAGQYLFGDAFRPRLSPKLAEPAYEAHAKLLA